MAYFLWRLFGAQCPVVSELMGILTWYETNQVTFDGRVKKLHNEKVFVADVSRVLGQYLNSCVVVSTTVGISAPGSRTPVSLAPLLHEIYWGTYHGLDRLLPALITILHQWDIRRRDSGLDRPGNHETRLQHEEAIQAAARSAGGNGGGRNGGGSGGGSGGGGGDGGGRGGSGGGDGGGGRDLPGSKGAVKMNPHHRPNLALLPGENTQDVLRTLALPTLGGSTWCKRWNHRGRCFENCPRRGSHVAPHPRQYAP